MSTELESIDSFEKSVSGEIKKLPNETTVLVLGILSILGCFCYAIPGLIMAIITLVLSKKDKALYESDPMAYENSYKNLKAGRICAIVGLSTSAAYFLFWIIYIIFIVFMITTAAAGQNSYPY
jgi:hypothetical protein